MSDSATPDCEKKDYGKETSSLAASSIACRSYRWMSDDDACWVENLPDAADGRTRRAQQREQKEDRSCQQELQSHHQMRLHHL